MAIRLFLALVAVVGIMWYLAWYNRASPEQRNRSLRSALLYGVGAALLLLVVTGRIPWLFAIFSAAVPWINRALTAKRLWSSFSRQQGQQQGTGNTQQQRQQQSQRPIESMTRAEALEILGLEPDADKQQIINAHRKLMSRVHPDKGGSDYLAKSINQARKVLLDEE